VRQGNGPAQGLLGLAGIDSEMQYKLDSLIELSGTKCFKCCYGVFDRHPVDRAAGHTGIIPLASFSAHQ
jgi:hypothetical protein